MAYGCALLLGRNKENTEYRSLLRDYKGEKIVEHYYDFHAEYESTRLFQDPYHMLEFIVTFHYLKKHLPKKGKVLDCGCGSGNYAIVLAGMGYRVALVDISQRLLDIAVEKFRRTGRLDRLISVVKTSSTNLSMFRDELFDAALCLGPLYHLPRKDDQIKTVRELRRVLKPVSYTHLTLPTTERV